jgi:hypothetical protein
LSQVRCDIFRCVDMNSLLSASAERGNPESKPSSVGQGRQGVEENEAKSDPRKHRLPVDQRLEADQLTP